MAGNLVQVSGTGDVVSGQRRLHSVVLTHTGAAGVLTVRDGSAGALRLTLRCTADNTATWQAGSRNGVPFATSLNVASLTGTASVEYS